LTIYISCFNYEILIISLCLIKTPSFVLYITMFSRKGKIFTFLFIFYFLFYAVSPLSHSLTQSDDATVTTGEKNCETKDSYLFFGDLIWLKFFQKKEHKGGSDNFRLLIKKARAILKSNNTIKLTQEYAIPDKNVFVLSLTRFYVSFIPEHLSSYNGFPSLFSGLSPPFPSHEFPC